MLVNFNFEKRDIISAHKSVPSPKNFEATYFHFNLIKENVTHFSQKVRHSNIVFTEI